MKKGCGRLQAKLMRRRLSSLRYLLLVALTASFLLSTTGVLEANSANEYYDYTYKVKLSKTQVQVNEPFIAQVESQGTCKEDLPATVNDGIIKGKILARHRTNNIEVVLNPEFEIEFDGIPSVAGESFKKDVSVTLIFPANSQPGLYDITAQTTSAMFQVLFFWVNGLSYLPTEPMAVGSIECLGSDSIVNTPTINSPTPNIPDKTIQSPTATITAISTPQGSSGITSPVNTTNPAGGNNPVRRNMWPLAGYIGGGVLVLVLISWQALSYFHRTRGKG